LPRHGIELMGECFKFVPGSDRDALRQVAAAELRGTGPQRLDRSHHAAGEEHAGQNREGERGEQHEG
jgi:hypothetical protein